MNITIGRWNPLRELEEFQHQLLTSFTPTLTPFGRSQQPANPQGADWLPPTDIVENENDYGIFIECSGLKKQDVNVSLENDLLTVSGQRKEPECAKYHQLERAYGSFSRTFRFPPDGDPASVSAGYEDGVLAIRIAKKESAKPRQIEVKVSD